MARQVSNIFGGSSRGEGLAGPWTRKLLLDLARTAEVRTNKLKAMFLTAFMNHEVTQDILAGMMNPMHNGLVSPAPYGNLYSFLGFQQPLNPIDPLYEFFENNIRFEYNLKTPIYIELSVKFPSREEVFDASEKLPWVEGGRGWPHQIEHGIAGIGYFFSIDGYGHSEGGIQLRKQLRGGRWKNRPYISALLNDFERNSSKMLKSLI